MAIPTLEEYKKLRQQGYNPQQIQTGQYKTKQPSVLPSQQTATTTQPTQSQETGFSLGKMLGNIPKSAGGVISGIKEAVVNPVQTIKGLGQVAAGGIQSLPGVSDFYTQRATETGKLGQLEQNKQAFQNVKNFFVERYGSIDKLTNTIEEDPVGFALDLSVVSSGGAGVLNKLKLAKPAGIASKIAEVSEPITATAKLTGKTTAPARKLSGFLAKGQLGIGTGAGPEAIRVAVKPRPPVSEFTTALRDTTVRDDIVSVARGAYQTLKDKRGAEYRTELAKIKGLNQKIDITPVQKSVQVKLADYGIKINKNGILDFSKSTIAKATSQKEIKGLVEDVLKWKDNTPLGIDTLKRRVGDLFTESGQGRALVQSIKGELRSILEKEVPGYAKMTNEYEKAGRLITEIDRGLSLGKQSSIDSAIKKLTSSLRENQDFRRELMSGLDASTTADLEGMIAGAALNPVVPSGLIGRAAFYGGPIGAFTLHPGIILSMITTSPRLVGEFLRALGIGRYYANNILEFLEKAKVASGLKTAEKTLFQAGRLNLRKNNQ